jgi:NADH-quinone oxidoreductase subunit N
MSPSFQTVRVFMQGNGAVILPEMELLLFAVGILLIDRWLEEKEKHWSGLLALSGLAFSAFTLWTLRTQIAATGDLFGFHDSILIDPFFLFFAALLLVATGLHILFSLRMAQFASQNCARHYALTLVAATGMLLMISGSDLFVLFLGLEIMSFAFWLLAAPSRSGVLSKSSPRKFAFAAALSSVPFIAGLALLYGLGGSSNIGRISMALNQRSDLANAIALSRQSGSRGEEMRQLLAARMPQALEHHWLPLQMLPVCALILIAAGLLRKMARIARIENAANGSGEAPIFAYSHTYAATAAATATFILFLRLLLTAFASSQETWLDFIAGLSLAGMVMASLFALRSVRLSELLLYCCVSQFAFMLLGLISANETGIVGIAFHLLIYVFMAAGAFAIVILLQQKESPEPQNFASATFQQSPAVAVLLTIFLLSFASLPLTAGFLAKYNIFKSLIETRHIAIAIAAILFLLPISYACIRTVLQAFRELPASEPQQQPVIANLTSAEAVALGICVFVTLAAGLYPEPFLRLARYAFGQ